MNAVFFSSLAIISAYITWFFCKAGVREPKPNGSIIGKFRENNIRLGPGPNTFLRTGTVRNWSKMSKKSDLLGTRAVAKYKEMRISDRIRKELILKLSEMAGQVQDEILISWTYSDRLVGYINVDDGYCRRNVLVTHVWC